MKVSWLIAVLLLLSVVTMTEAATTSGYLSPQVTPTFTFFPSLTYYPSFTFSFPTVTSTTHMFTFFPSFTFIFTGTSTMPTNSTVVQMTDWAVVGIDAFPPTPQPGDQMVFSMSLAALSSNMPFPQHVYVQCQIDGFSCGAGIVHYSGPVGSVATVSANGYWPATPGTHILTWFVDTTLDPNPGNNALSIQFFVPVPQAPTSVMPSVATTQVSTSTQPPTTVVQTSVQTVTQSPSQTSTAAMGFSLQDYTWPLIGIIVLLVLALAVSMRRRKSQPTSAQGNSWFCTRCGAPNMMDSSFCAKCGSAKPKL